jgi:hypothetical protein
VSGSSESMKQVYCRYLDCLNRKPLAVYLAGALPSLLYDLFILPGFKHSVASMMSFYTSSTIGNPTMLKAQALVT